MVPFSIGHAYGGFAECRGVVRAEPEGLFLEFQAKDSFFGVLKSDVRSLAVPWQDLAAVEFSAGWFSARLELRTRSLKTLAEVPGADGCRLRLGIGRKDRSTARELASFASLRLCEHDLRQMQSEIERRPPRR